MSASDLKLMRCIDELHMQYPFAGSRMMRDLLNRQGHHIGRRHTRTLMKKMGIQALYCKPNLSQANQAHRKYPYLLKGLAIQRSNQVWSTDITYIPMAKGFVYLCAVIDWHSRKVLAHRVSISMEVDFCISALNEAIEKYGSPEIFNTDQGSQFTSDAFIDVLKSNGIQISMDGKGRWVDNVMVERLWRSVKYEEVYLKAYSSVTDAKKQLSAYFEFYNLKRPHSSLDKMTPNEFYYIGKKDSPIKDIIVYDNIIDAIENADKSIFIREDGWIKYNVIDSKFNFEKGGFNFDEEFNIYKLIGNSTRLSAHCFRLNDIKIKSCEKIDFNQYLPDSNIRKTGAFKR